MAPTFRIAVLGIGGVGGYVGGRLAAAAQADGTEIIFIVRGAHEKALRENGLMLVTSQGTTTARPALVTGRPQEVGPVDLIICCVKDYDLDQAIHGLEPCVSRPTVVLPLLNGVNATPRISRILPQAEVWESCIYLISRLTSPGVVTQTGNINRLLFGSDRAKQSELSSLCDRFRAAGIDAAVTENPRGAVWEKFIFLSPIATATSFLDKSIGQVFENSTDRQLLLALMNELHAVARKMKIALPASIVNDTLDKLSKMPYEAVPSMLADFRKGSRTEVDALTNEVTSLGRELGVPTPRYDQLGRELAARLQGRSQSR